MKPRSLSPLSLLPLLAACELTEVTVPSGQPMVIVQAVLSSTRPVQFVLVEQSLTGAQPALGSRDPVPPEEPSLPIVGATVTLTHEGPTACSQPSVPLNAVPESRGIYTTASLCPLNPGDRIALRVETPDGTIVTGTTTVPGAAGVIVRVGADTAAFEFEELGMHRERDTVRIGIDPIVARAMQVEVRRWDEQDEVAIYLFTDTLGVALAGNLINPFEGDSGETVFRAGRSYLLAVAVTDTNYYDFIRSRSDPLTGRGFINHLQGGIGVFGSVETRTWVLHVVTEVDDAREGTYRAVGRVGAFDVDVTLELYLDDLEPDEFSAFIRGPWVDGGVIQRSVDGRFGRGGANANVFDGSVTVPGPNGGRFRYFLSGQRAAAGAPFDVIVVGQNDEGVELVRTTLRATQVDGPAQ